MSHAQFGEDILIVDFFGPGFRGFYIDVGANDGISGSNTALLEKLGWTGILVEPNQKLAENCRRLRPGSQTFAVAAVGPDAGDRVTLFEYDGASEQGAPLHALSRVGQVSHLHSTVESCSKVTPVEVMAATLDAIIAQSGMTRRIDFLSLDIEGHELAALKGLDLKKHQPRVIVVEENSSGENASVQSYLESFGYIKVDRTGVNDWYVQKSDFHYFRFRWILEKIRGACRKSLIFRAFKSDHPLLAYLNIKKNLWVSGDPVAYREFNRRVALYYPSWSPGDLGRLLLYRLLGGRVLCLLSPCYRLIKRILPWTRLP